MSTFRTNPTDPVSFLIDEDSIEISATGSQIDLRSLTSPDTIVVRDIDDLDDLPRVSDGIILTSGKTYQFLGDVLMMGFPLIVTGPVSIVGGGAGSTFLRCDAATPLITLRGPDANLDIRELSLINAGGPCIAFETLTPSVAAERTINAMGVNFTGVGDVVRFQDGAFGIFLNCAWLGCDGVGVVTDRETLGLVVSNCAFRQSANNFIAIQKPATSVIATRIRVSASSIQSPTGGYGLSIDPTGLGDERLVVTDVNFNGGGDAIEPGTVGPDSAKAYFKINLGVESTYPRAAFAMTTPAAFSLGGTPTKLAGVTTGFESQLFDFPASNRARYIGSKPRRFLAIASATIETAANNQRIRLNFAIDGVADLSYVVTANTSGGGGNRREAIPLTAVLNLDPNSYVELWATNLSGTTNTTWDEGQVVLTEIGG